MYSRDVTRHSSMQLWYFYFNKGIRKMFINYFRTINFCFPRQTVTLHCTVPCSTQWTEHVTYLWLSADLHCVGIVVNCWNDVVCHCLTLHLSYDQTCNQPEFIEVLLLLSAMFLLSLEVFQRFSNNSSLKRSKFSLHSIFSVSFFVFKFVIVRRRNRLKKNFAKFQILPPLQSFHRKTFSVDRQISQP